VSTSPDKPKYKAGNLGKVKAKVAQIVADHHGKVSDSQALAIATDLEMKPTTVKRWIQEARKQFLSKAERYVSMHEEACQAALESETVKGFEQARLGAEWAIQHLSQDGEGIVEKSRNDTNGVKVFVGLQLGGAVEPAQD